MRKRIYANNAERQKAYRNRLPTDEQKRLAHRLQGWIEENPDKRKQSKANYKSRKRQEARENKPFIAIDGEGITRGNKHIYTLLTASTGDYIESWIGGLSTKRCFDFLLQFRGRGILVGFFTGYDVNMMLRDVPLWHLEELWNLGETKWDGYEIRWMVGKMLILTKDGKRITWYDAASFFQKSFIAALQDWGFTVDQEIVEGKANRQTFDIKNRKVIRYYNLRECELLTQLMQRVREVALDCGILPKSWHGAGALANAGLAKYGVEKYNADCLQLRPKFLQAYYGGRSQVLLQGEFDNAWSHDINSAYPYALSMLPNANGQWCKTKKENSPFALYEVKFDIPKKYAVTPFPVRYKDKIYYPHKGHTFVWSPEYDAANLYYSKYLKIVNRWQFVPENDYKPFAFCAELYEKRKAYVAQKNDAQIILKLFLNSCYGKVAQSIGYKKQRPPFQNYFWAGYVTSKTRAMVFSAAMQSPDTVISFATDGILSTEQLADHSPAKPLGGWEVKRVSNLFVIQPGVYTYTGIDESEATIRSRGFRKSSVDYNALRQVWRSEGSLGKYDYKETRFIGLGKALQSNPKLKNWRQWIVEEREISFIPNGETQLLPDKVIRIIPFGQSEVTQGYKLKDDWVIDEESEESLL